MQSLSTVNYGISVVDINKQDTSLEPCNQCLNHFSKILINKLQNIISNVRCVNLEKDNKLIANSVIFNLNNLFETLRNKENQYSSVLFNLFREKGFAKEIVNLAFHNSLFAYVEEDLAAIVGNMLNSYLPYLNIKSDECVDYLITPLLTDLSNLDDKYKKAIDILGEDPYTTLPDELCDVDKKLFCCFSVSYISTQSLIFSVINSDNFNKLFSEIFKISATTGKWLLDNLNKMDGNPESSEIHALASSLDIDEESLAKKIDCKIIGSIATLQGFLAIESTSCLDIREKLLNLEIDGYYFIEPFLKRLELDFSKLGEGKCSEEMISLKNRFIEELAYVAFQRKKNVVGLFNSIMSTDIYTLVMEHSAKSESFSIVLKGAMLSSFNESFKDLNKFIQENKSRIKFNQIDDLEEEFKDKPLYITRALQAIKLSSFENLLSSEGISSSKDTVKEIITNLFKRVEKLKGKNDLIPLSLIDFLSGFISRKVSRTVKGITAFQHTGNNEELMKKFEKKVRIEVGDPVSASEYIGLLTKSKITKIVLDSLMNIKHIAKTIASKANVKIVNNFLSVYCDSKVKRITLKLVLHVSKFILTKMMNVVIWIYDMFISDKMERYFEKTAVKAVIPFGSLDTLLGRIRPSQELLVSRNRIKGATPDEVVQVLRGDSKINRSLPIVDMLNGIGSINKYIKTTNSKDLKQIHMADKHIYPTSVLLLILSLTKGIKIEHE